MIVPVLCVIEESVEFEVSGRCFVVTLVFLVIRELFGVYTDRSEFFAKKRVLEGQQLEGRVLCFDLLLGQRWGRKLSTKSSIVGRWESICLP